MARPDDCTLTPREYARVRREAERALREADAIGIFPTPINRILAVAKVQQAEEDALQPGLIDRLRLGAARARQTVKRAISKILGVFHASEGLIFLNRQILAVKRRFVTFHESGHGFLPWQRPMYAVVEDCEKSLDGATAALFDREANVFASEVLFQLDTFREMAAGEAFSIWTPVRLAKRFDASNYAAIRQYVSKSDRICAVVVLNMPELVPGDGIRATLRRAIQSETFTAQFGRHSWPETYTPDDKIGALIPVGKQRSSGKRSLGLTDRNGVLHDCIAESFSTTYQVFVLIHSVRTLTARRVLLSASAGW